MIEHQKELILGIIGGFIYVCLELLWRGRSHWTMFVLGAVCFVILGCINELLTWSMPIWKQAAIGTAIITVLEFATGCVVNLWLGWNVWDYSNTFMNLLGQICLPYIILWIPVAIFGIVLDDYLRYWLFNEEKPHYKIY